MQQCLHWIIVSAICSVLQTSKVHINAVCLLKKYQRYWQTSVLTYCLFAGSKIFFQFFLLIIYHFSVFGFVFLFQIQSYIVRTVQCDICSALSPLLFPFVSISAGLAFPHSGWLRIGLKASSFQLFLKHKNCPKIDLINSITIQFLCHIFTVIYEIKGVASACNN